MSDFEDQNPEELYAKVFVAWTEAQSMGLRRVRNTHGLDSVRLAEEIESLSRQEIPELKRKNS